MTLEALVVCIDCSAFARDGEPSPSRLVAQTDAAEIVASAYLNQHRENAVSLLAMGGVEGARVCASPTNDFGKLHSALHGISPGGVADFVRGILVAQLVLKHRQDKNQRQRILLFVGSPVATPEKALVHLAKQLKKNNVALDIVLLSNHEENRAKLEAMHAAVNSNNSRFMDFDASGGRLLSEFVMAEMMAHGAEGAVGVEGGAVPGADFDPNQDPELLMVIRMSLEEAQQQQQNSANAQDANSGGAGEGAEEMDEELRQAVLLSLQEFSGGETNSGPQETSADTPEGEGGGPQGSS